MAKIQEWWEEPQIVEPEWENVDKKSKKKQQQQERESRGGGRGPGRGGGGGRSSTSRGGGRGGGSERRGRGDKRRSFAPTQTRPQEEQQPKVEPQNNGHDAPSPVVKAPAPKGAWGQRAAASAPELQPAPAPLPASPAKPVTPVRPQVPEPMPDVGVVAPQDPTPSGMNMSTSAATTPSKAGGNVWATKGSAHLIQAEKPKPPPPPSPQPMRMPPPSVEPPPQSPVKEMALESGLPSTLSGGSWHATNSASIEITQSSASVTETTIGSMPSEIPVVPQEPPGSSPKPAPSAPTNVLNMGHWESGEADDSQNLDFGFGSFGPDNDAVEEPSTPSTRPKDTATTVSPARPPPGLSLGGGSMPPMPANAVLVHELENKLEGASLTTEEQSAPKPMTSNLPSQPPPPPGQPTGGVPTAPPGVSQNYNAAYGGMGMYNYNNGGASGFMGQQGAPALGGGPPQQKLGQAPAGAPQHLQQAPPAGLYGTAAPSSGTPGDSSTAPSSTETSTASAIPPPGMPNAMAYNPALFYGQQPYQAMGQPHGGVAGYGYGYGAQFGAAGGFYGQQVMGQSGGYPPYDDQPPQGRDYPSKGRNSYRNTGNQYQNQFNPQQHGGYGYGGQPMGGYDHFNQARGGYGHGPPTDAHGYGMPQQQGSSNYEGKKGGRFQQHQQLGGGSSGHDQHQQNAPFLGSNNDTSSSNQGGSGWSNNNNSNTQGGGGWGQPSAWQGGN